MTNLLKGSALSLLAILFILTTGVFCSADVTATVLAEGPPLVDPVGITVSPDGNTLYISDYSNNAVYSMPSDGGALTLLDSGYQLNNLRNITVSPDNSTIYIAGFWTNNILTLPTTGGTAAQLTPVYSPTSVALSHDGTTLYITSNYGSAVYSIPATGGSLKVLAQGAPFGTAGSGPNGVAVSNDDKTLYISAGNSGLYSLPADGGTPTLLYAASSTIIPGMLTLSKDGSTIYFVDVSANRNSDPSGIYSIPVSGGSATLVYQGPALATSGYLTVSPDGTKLYYADPGYLDRYNNGPVGVPGRVIMFSLVTNHPPVANAGVDQTVEQQTCQGAKVTLDGSGSSDPDGDSLTYLWTWDGGSATGSNPQVLLPSGTTTITLTVTDSEGASATDTVTITISETTAPTLSVSVTPALLWPPNHRLVTITPNISVSDACTGSVQVQLYSVTSNEPDNSTGDGNTNGDIVLDNGIIKLRAERAGHGNGRIYTITFRATDEAGNITDATATVTVPANMKELKPSREHSAIRHNK